MKFDSGIYIYSYAFGFVNKIGCDMAMTGTPMTCNQLMTGTSRWETASLSACSTICRAGKLPQL